VIKTSRIALSILLCINIVLALCAPAFAQAQSSADILTISTREEFEQFAASCILDSYSKGLSVQLTADIDLSESDFSGIPTFSGIFEGDGHTLSGLSIETNGSVQGLFRYLRPGSVVRDLNVEGTIAPGGSHRQVGGIAGRNAGRIEHCTFSGEVTGADSIGGIAGFNELTGIIENCSASGTVHGDHFIGGIAGENRGVVRGCENHANINAQAAQNSIAPSDLTLESLTGSESAGTATDMGGIAGSSSGVIRSCLNYGTVGYPHIGYNVGGIAGSQTGYIVSCENHGPVFGRKEAGGIVGQMEPGILLSYDTDTLQQLHGQLIDLSGIIDSTAHAAQSGYGQLDNQAGQLQGHINNALDAMGQLGPGNPDSPPDEDSTNAAMNNLNSALSSINGTVIDMNQSGQDQVTELADMLGDLIGQINSISSTLGNASQGLGGTITDISDADTSADTSGKVEACINSGSVDADINAGGIVGAMSVENDLDPEDDFSVSGSTSLNFDCEARAVVLNCENHGTVTSKKQNTGGIAGYMMLGLVRGCGNTGAVDAPAAHHVGGIAGYGAGYVRSCWVKCTLDGEAYIGGIAGQSENTVTDCLAMVSISEGSEKTGSIMGFSEALASMQNSGSVSGNYYLPVGRDIGGVDGISYSGAAQSLTSEEFFSIASLPEAFSTITLRFVFEDGTENVLILSPGQALEYSDIPAIPQKDGYSAHWEGLENIDTESVRFDALLTAVYEPMLSILACDMLSEDGMPLMLALGTFSNGDVVELTAIDSLSPLADNVEPVCGWMFTLPENASVTQLRMRIPKDIDTERIQLSLGSKDGSWKATECFTDGSYLVFSPDPAAGSLRIDLLSKDYTLEIFAASATALLIVTGIIVSAIRKRRETASETTD